MLYRKVRKTGDELSILGFGCMRLPTNRYGRIQTDRATKQVRSAIDMGVNYVETAMPYHMGASETFVGHALQDGYRDKVKLATKLSPWNVKAPEDMEKIIRSQLQRLRTDHLDYYLLHSLNRPYWESIRKFNVLYFLDQEKKRGRIKYAGFSFHGDREIFKVIVDQYDWDFCEIQYSFLDETCQAGKEGLEYAAAKNLGIFIMSPLHGGNLGSKAPPAVQSIWDEAEVKRSPAEWSFRWLWNHPEITCVLSGMNEEYHIEENLRIASEAHPNSLTPSELKLFDRVKQLYNGMTKTGCTGCSYCMPCVAGVDIPHCFDLYDKRQMFPKDISSKVMYVLHMGGLTGEAAIASQCIRCGKCEAQCPQGLPVIELLRNVTEEFEGPAAKIIIWTAKQLLAFQKWTALRKLQ